VLGFRPDFIEHQLAQAVRDPNGRALQPDGSFGGAPEDDAGLGGLPGQAQERRRRDSDSQGRLENEALIMETKLQQLTVDERI
jgi:hypothetical protein